MIQCPTSVQSADSLGMGVTFIIAVLVVMDIVIKIMDRLDGKYKKFVAEIYNDYNAMGAAAKVFFKGVGKRILHSMSAYLTLLPK